MLLEKPKIALVADWITHFGGAERVFIKLMEMYPDADIYTSVYFPVDDLKPYFSGKKIHTSFIQHIPYFNRKHKLCMMLRPLAFSRFDFSEYDLVISSTSAEAKGIITKRTIKPPSGRGNGNIAGTQGDLLGTNPQSRSSTAPSKRSFHVCYCHTPTRYLWSHTEQYKNFLEFGCLNWLAKITIPPVFKLMKKWDYRAAQRPDIFIANSETTKSRIAQFYNRESHVVYPFFEQKDLGSQRDENVGNRYFMCLGRIVPYKRFDLAIEACNQLGYNLKVFTNTINPESERLQKLSGPTIQWIFRATDHEVAEEMSHAEAFIMPQEEDFGIVALEAMSHGTPVIAYGEGGATETVIHGQTGLFFSQQTVESLVYALEKSTTMEWDHGFISEHTSIFSEERFEQGISQIVEETLAIQN